MGLGSYPDVGVATALAAGQAARELLAQDIDPIDARVTLCETPTFEEAARIRWNQIKPGFRNARHI